MPAIEPRLRLFHIGLVSLKTAGSGLISGAYQPTPKPSALIRVLDCIASLAWWTRLFEGL